MRQAAGSRGDSDVVHRVYPPADLRPLVEAFAGRSARTQRAMFPVFPTARAELMFHFADPFFVADAASAPVRAIAPVTLLGPRMANYWQTAGPGIDWFMVQLSALGCERVLGVPFAEAWERTIDLTALWRGAAMALHERLRAARSFEARVEIAVGELRRRFAEVADKDNFALAGNLVRAGRIRTIESLCAHLDVGPRRLHQRFVASYGVSPKLFLTLMRFGRQLESRHPILAARNSDMGEDEYNDDSHAIREFRRFSGMTPGAYARQKSTGDRLIYTGAQIILASG